jgi:uncharacterized membrane protein
MSTWHRPILLALGVTALLLAGGVAMKGWCLDDPSAHDLYLRWCYSDIPPLFHAENLASGAFPYFDHPVEYPVLTGMAMWVASLFASTSAGFFAATAVVLFAAGLGTTWLLVREVGWPRVLAFAAGPKLVISGFVNWDLLAVVAATAGLVAHRRGRHGWSGALLGIGTATKLYPAILLVPIVIAEWRTDRRRGVETAAAAAGAWLVINLPFMLLARDGWWRFYEFSRERAVDWDSLLFVLRQFGDVTLSTAEANVLTGGLFITGSLVLLTIAARRDPPRAMHLVALPLLGWFLLTSKVWSSQFTLWMLPLLVLAFPGWRAWLLFVVADAAVFFTRAPYLANFVGDGLEGAWPYEPFGVAVLVRAVITAVVIVLGWRRAVAEHGLEARSGLAFRPA